MKRGLRCDYLNLPDDYTSESNEVPLLKTYRAGLEYTFVHRRPQFLENENEDGYCNIFDKLTTHNESNVIKPILKDAFLVEEFNITRMLKKSSFLPIKSLHTLF